MPHWWLPSASLCSCLASWWLIFNRCACSQRCSGTIGNPSLQAQTLHCTGCVYMGSGFDEYGYYEEYYGRRPQPTQWGRRWSDRVSR